ncbi:MAG: hypothetical protein ACXWXV_13890 [Aeromicrobium sp.]
MSKPASTPKSKSSTSPQSSSASGGGGSKKDVPKGCRDIVASGAVEDIARLFKDYLKNPKAANAMDAPAMRKALEDLSKAADDAPMKTREDALMLVADMGALVDTYLGLPGVGKVPSTGQMQREIDTLCVPKG